MPVATKLTKEEAMLSLLRARGATGANRNELFDTLKIANPDYLAERLRARGHSLTEEPEEVHHAGGMTGVTTRFTLVVDAADQKTMFEGDATDQLSTWHEDPVEWDELRARQAARRQ